MAYIINIINGTATAPIANGSYPVTASVVGYSNASIDPNPLVVDAGTNTYPLTVAATGTLTLHVSEDGTSGGTAVVGAKFIRCNLDGTITYGTEKTSASSGDVTFDAVPFAAAGAPVIYYKQTASDGSHMFDSGTRNVQMAASTQTVQIPNLPGTNRTVNLTDENYSGLPIAAGTLSLTLS